jgi:hypothetical protein
MADPPHPARASVAKCLRYIFVGFLSLGFAVGPMVPVWLTNGELRDDPNDPQPNEAQPTDPQPTGPQQGRSQRGRSRRPRQTAGPPVAPGPAGHDDHAGTRPPRLAAERPLTLRPYNYRPGPALNGVEQAAWAQVVRQLRPAVGQDWTGMDRTTGKEWEGPE